MSRQSKAYQQQQLQKMLAELRAGQQAEADRFASKTADDPAWQALRADPAWQALARKWERSSKRWHENRELLERIRDLASAYGLPKPRPIDTPQKLGQWIDEAIRMETRAKRAGGSAPESMPLKAEQARQIAVAVRAADPALPPLPQRDAGATADLLALRDWCTTAAGQQDKPTAASDKHSAAPAIVVDDTDCAILRGLAKANRAMIYTDLEQWAYRSAKTCAERVPALLAAGLVGRKSKRGGVFITAKGREYLARIPEGRGD